MLEDIHKLCTRMEFVGSRVTCNPPPTNTDQDILVLAKGPQFRELERLLDTTWKLCGSKPSVEKDDIFISYRQGELNIIATQSEEFFDLFMSATKVCKAFNVMEKKSRVAVFEAVMTERSIRKAVSIILLT